MTEDYSVPRNLTDSLFKNFELPQVSHIQPKKRNDQRPQSLQQSKYRQSEDDILNLELGQISKIVPKKIEGTGSNNQKKSQSNSTQGEQLRPPSKIIPNSFQFKRKNKSNHQPQQPKQIDIDKEIVAEIEEWGEKGVKNDSDQDDFDAEEKVGETKEQLQIRKRIEQKLKNGFGQNHKGGLQAKAEQLRKQKQTKPQSSQSLLPKKQAQKKQLEKLPSIEHETSAQLLSKKSEQKQQVKIEKEQSEQDPWDKINEKTIQAHNVRKEKQKEMTIDLVIKYYKEQFEFQEADIEIEAIEQPQRTEEKQKGCMEFICSCFKTEKKKKRAIKNNISLAKRLVAISQKQLMNTQQQFYILQQIWNKLTTDTFSRYGAHWNKIGFQGRDPATDLRSTGVLSILQWLLFLENHPKQGKTYSVWSIQNEYPLALTHIKITGVFLDLLLKGKIQGQKWQQFQKIYNSLILGMFKRMKEQFKGGSTLGTLVEEEARNIKQNYEKQISNYESEFKN